jgi:hypothetical protein
MIRWWQQQSLRLTAQMRLFALPPAFVPSPPPTASATFSPVITNTTHHFDTKYN